MTILIADESVDVRKRLVELVSGLPGEVFISEAGSAREAIAAIQRLNPQVVIMDFHMPNGSSLQAVSAVRALTATSCLIKMSAFPFPQYSEKCLRAGADYFFDKTSASEQIATVLKKLLAQPPGWNNF